MTNYYQTERYPFYLIHAFATSQRNLNHSPLTLTAQEVKDKLGSTPEYYYALNGERVKWQNRVDVYYHFIDDEQETPALAFLRLPYDEQEDGDYHHMYALVYIDPSLVGLWKHEMDQERAEEGT